MATPGPDVVDDEFQVLLAELVDDLGAYLAARPGDGVRSLADVVAYEGAHAEIELPGSGTSCSSRLSAPAAASVRPTGRPGPATSNGRSAPASSRRSTDADVLVAPAYGPAWKSDLVVGGHAGAISSWVTTPAAIAGWPIMSVPVGLVHGLPVGLALIVRPGEEWTLLEAARIVESVVAATDPLPRPGWSTPGRG